MHRPVQEQRTVLCKADWAESQGAECDHQGPTKGNDVFPGAQNFISLETSGPSPTDWYVEA